jgi:transcriptional regulator
MSPDALPVVRGTLETLALHTLASGREMHGFEIIEWIHRTSGDELQVEQGALYPALHRMEERGWLTSLWRVSEKGRKAKYYRLTRTGRRALAEASGRWARYVAAMGRLAGAPEGRS